MIRQMTADEHADRRRLGIIDVGTNSAHLLIGEVGPGGRFRVILERHDPIRLGDGGLAAGALSLAAMRRAMAVLRRYAVLLKRRTIDEVAAVATSAVREARNGRAFARQVRSQLGLPLRIISGREEGRLIYLGVRSLSRARGPVLLVAIGGGSAQVAQGEGARLRYSASLPLGCARLAERFIRHDPPRPEELDALRAYARAAWAPVARALRRRHRRVALGSSSTIGQLMRMIGARRHGRCPARARPLTVSRRSLREAVAQLAGPTASERRRLPVTDPRHRDLLLATGMALLTWMEGCGVSVVRYAPGSLREGLLATYSGSMWHGPTRQRR